MSATASATTAGIAPSTSDVAPPDAGSALAVRAFMVTGCFWLVIGSALGLFVALKLTMPAFLADAAELSYGRLRPAHVAAMIFGWASLAGIGMLLRLRRSAGNVPLRWPNLLVTGCALWNIALLGGLCVILSGRSTGVAWLELPPLCYALFAAVAILVTIECLATADRGAGVDPLVAGFLWIAVAGLPFVLFSALGSLSYAPRGLAASLAYGFNASALVRLWLTPIALAAACDLVPRLNGRALGWRPLATIGFWAYLLAAPWSAWPHASLTEPVPARPDQPPFVIALLLTCALGAVCSSLLRTLCCERRKWLTDPLLALVSAAVISLVFACLQSLLLSRDPAAQLSHEAVAQVHLHLAGFFSLVVYALPYHTQGQRVRSGDIPPYWIQVQTWTALAGVGLYWIALTVGGIVQVHALVNPDWTPSDLTRVTLPWVAIRAIAGYLMLLASIVFAALLIGCGCSRPRHAEMH